MGDTVEVAVFPCYLPGVLTTHSTEQLTPDLPGFPVLSQRAGIQAMLFLYTHEPLTMTKSCVQAEGHLRSDY